jgi:hypothetical protein
MQLVDAEIVPSTRMITPAGSIEDAIYQFELYQELRKRIGTAGDFQQIGEKHHPKKSFVRKVQRFFNVSCEIIQDEPLRDADGTIIAWLARARAVHLGTGAYQEGDGACAFEEKTARDPLKEKQLRTIHNIRAHAITRAKNRAILDLVGFGEVSAEEINIEDGDYLQREAVDSKTNTYPMSGQVTTNQRKAIFAIGKEKGLTKDQVKKVIRFQAKKESTQDLTKQEASDLITLLKEAASPELMEMVQAIEQEQANSKSAIDDQPLAVIDLEELI